MEKQPLSVGELLGILGIFIGVFVGVSPMTWWIKTLILFIPIAMIIYAVNNLRWTIGLLRIQKVMLSVSAFLILVIISWYPIQDQWTKDHIASIKDEASHSVGVQPKQLTAEEIAKEVVKNLPNQSTTEVKQPYFVAAPKLIIDALNNVQSLDIIITNIGKNAANPMFCYTLIYQTNPTLIVMVHPQSFTNDLIVGLSRVIHEPSVKTMDLKGDQYVFLYLHYTDLISKKKYSQSFYFERVNYNNRYIGYADASAEHKKEIESIRKGHCSVIEKLVNSGADENALRAAMKQQGSQVQKITDF